MRRDRTWKICANHYSNIFQLLTNKTLKNSNKLYPLVTPNMQLKPNCDSDKAWIWSVPADFADETPKPELLAVRFANSESQYNSVFLKYFILKKLIDNMFINFVRCQAL